MEGRIVEGQLESSQAPGGRGKEIEMRSTIQFVVGTAVALVLVCGGIAVWCHFNPLVEVHRTIDGKVVKILAEEGGVMVEKTTAWLKAYRGHVTEVPVASVATRGFLERRAEREVRVKAKALREAQAPQ